MQHTDNPSIHLLGLSLLTPLSARQQQIAHYLTTTSLPFNQISYEIGISEATVRSYARIVYAKHGVAGRVELIHKLMNVIPKLQKENENETTFTSVSAPVDDDN